jgi:hypothetical protein
MMVGIHTQEVKHFKMVNKSLIGSTVRIAYNVPTLGEGGDFNHKCRCGEQMLNIAVNVKRSTAPPLLPNVCYAFVPYL